MLPCNQSHDLVLSGACHVTLPFTGHQEQDVLPRTLPSEKPKGAVCTQMPSLTHTVEEEVFSHFHGHWWKETTKNPFSALSSRTKICNKKHQINNSLQLITVQKYNPYPYFTLISLAVFPLASLKEQWMVTPFLRYQTAPPLPWPSLGTIFTSTCASTDLSGAFQTLSRGSYKTIRTGNKAIIPTYATVN